jgi:hypothetical protein
MRTVRTPSVWQIRFVGQALFVALPNYFFVYSTLGNSPSASDGEFPLQQTFQCLKRL